MQNAKRTPTVSGTFTPPADLRPAIEALGKEGRQYLEDRVGRREVTHKDVAAAADYERGDLNG